MFTGIIQSTGSVTAVSSDPDGLCLSVDLNQLELERVHLGDSIAVNGTCLTVARVDQSVAHFDVSNETLTKCLIADWDKGRCVNLELALTLESPIGGHLVSGHVDGIAKLMERCDSSEFTVMKFETEVSIGKFIAIKGSVALDGVSLTTNNVIDKDNRTYYDVALVPHTLGNTTFGALVQGSSVHIEVDQIARYLHRLSECEVL